MGKIKVTGEEVVFKIFFIFLTTGLFSIILFAFPHIPAIVLKIISIVLFGFATFKVSILYWATQNKIKSLDGRE